MTPREYSSQLYRSLSSTSYRVAMGVLRDHDRALDITQDVLLNTYQKMSGLDDEERLAGYVARAAYNRALNEQRNVAARRAKLEGEMDMPTSSNSAIPGEQGQRRAIVSEAVSQLAERQSQALTLRFFQGLKIREIALVMAISEGAVKTHLGRGLTNLKSLLEDFEGVL